jgi:DNA repair protein RecO (recombination protein O)
MLEAVVLSRRNFREYDEMVSLYTKERGKVEILARGVKKIVSKNAPYLEPFSHIYAGVVPGKEIEHLTNVQSLSYFLHIRKDLQSSRSSYFVVDWLDHMLSPGQKDPALFHLLLSWLSFVDDSHFVSLGLLDAFMLKATSFFGFEPHLDGCVVCGTPLIDQIQVFFSFENGGVLCQTHRNMQNNPSGEVLSFAVVLSLQYFLGRSWREIVAYEIPSQKETLHEFIHKYLLYTLEKPTLDWNFEKNK